MTTTERRPSGPCLTRPTPGDAAVLRHRQDRFSRALHLCLRQDFPEVGAPREQRFDHAERLQVMHRQWKSEDYASHYLGPKGVVPKRLSEVEDVLRGRIAELFPQSRLTRCC